MIARKTDRTITQPYSVVMEILQDNKDYFLTKEEIYERLPYIGDEKSITISQLTNVLRQMRNCMQIEVWYIRGRAYYALIVDR